MATGCREIFIAKIGNFKIFTVREKFHKELMQNKWVWKSRKNVLLVFMKT